MGINEEQLHANQKGFEDNQEYILKRELLAKYTKWQNEIHYNSDKEMYLDIDKFLIFND